MQPFNQLPLFLILIFISACRVQPGASDFAGHQIQSGNAEPNPQYDPCWDLVKNGKLGVHQVDLNTDITTISMETIAGSRQTRFTMELFNLGPDAYQLGACMKKEAYVRLRQTKLCSPVYQYSASPQAAITTPIGGNGAYIPLEINFQIPGGNRPSCSMYFIEVHVDSTESVYEIDETNNNTTRFCYHINQGILNSIQPNTAQDCIDNFNKSIYVPKGSR